MEDDSKKNSKANDNKNDGNFELPNFIKKLAWQDWLFIGITIILIIIQLQIIAPLKSLPSPMYGGDFYYHLGKTNHLMRGGSIFESPQLKGEAPWSPFLYQEIAAKFSTWFNVDPINVYINLSILVMILSFAVMYYFGTKFFNSKNAGILLAFFYYYMFPIFKYTEFTLTIIMPLFFFLTWIAMEKKKWYTYALAGLSYGLLGISHTMLFLVATLFLGILIFYKFIFQFTKFRSKFVFHFDQARSFFKANWSYFALLLIIGLAIAQLYWFQPIFKFHLNTPNAISEYDSPNIQSVGIMKTFSKEIKGGFFNFSFSSWYNSFFSIILLLSNLGIILLLLSRKRPFKYNYLLMILITYFIGTFHYLITLPLLKKEFFHGMFMNISLFMLPMMMVTFLYIIIPKIKFLDKKYYQYVFIFFTLLFLIFAFNIKQDFVENQSTFFQAGYNPLPSFMQDMSRWFKANTDIHDVVVAPNEISFMLNSLTGNKVMSARRAHSGMWVDVDKRWADTAVFLYGNNSIRREEIIEEYNLKYLYWQYNWITLDYYFNNEGQLYGWFDPLLIRDINNYDEYLSENGVNFQKIKTYLDPANKIPEVQQFDALLVIPSHWNATHPWNDDLDKFLTPVTQFTEQGQVAAIVYEIKS